MGRIWLRAAASVRGVPAAGGGDGALVGVACLTGLVEDSPPGPFDWLRAGPSRASGTVRVSGAGGVDCAADVDDWGADAAQFDAGGSFFNGASESRTGGATSATRLVCVAGAPSARLPDCPIAPCG